MKLKHWLSLSIIAQIVFVVSMVEVFDVCMIALVILCAYFCIFSKEKIRGWKLFVIFLAFVLQIGFMLSSKYVVVNEVDAYASQLIGPDQCRPDTGNLPEDGKWVKSKYTMERIFGDFGYSRRMHYQYDGLLRYGFLYDSKRTIWLNKCSQ